MEIALLHYSCPPVVGGVESVLAQHARLMADAGHCVRVVAGRGAQFDDRVPLVVVPLADSRHPDVLAVKAELDAGRVSPGFSPLADEIARALRSALDGVELVIAHNVCSLHKNLALTAALGRLCQSPASDLSLPFHLILWHHDLAWTTPRYRAELRDGYPWDLLRSDWPGARHVVVSEMRRRELVKLIGLPPQTIAVVPSGVDAAAFLKLEPRTREIVARLKLLDAEPLLLLPVRITPRKNIEFALRVLSELRGVDSSPGGDVPVERLYGRAALVVTGPPGPHNPANAEYFARLKTLRAELGLDGSAHFLAEAPADTFVRPYDDVRADTFVRPDDDFLPDEVIADFFRLADALFMPSREEGFGIPVIEAGLARLPVFCADLPPLRELGGEAATYFSPDAEPRAVAELIADRLRADPQFQLAARVRRGYLWERLYAEKIAPLLQA